MATKKKTDELEQENVLSEEMENTASVDVNDENTPPLEAEKDGEKQDDIEDKGITDGENKLFSVAELAMYFRVPSWQLAALLKLLDIEDDKLLTRCEFAKGLEALTKRKMGS